MPGIRDGLGDASPLNDEVLQAVATRLNEDPSVYVRAIAAGTLGCLGRRAIATGVGQALIPACLEALVQNLGREENRLAMDALSRLAHLRPEGETTSDLQAEVSALLAESPMRCWESLSRSGLRPA